MTDVKLQYWGIDSIFKVSSWIKWLNKKKSQIICKGIIETTSVSKYDKYEDDFAKVMNMFKDINCSVKDSDVKFVRRIGKKEAGKCRPICIGFMNEDIKQKILHFSYRLSNSVYWKNVKLQTDLTYEQRQDFKDQMEIKRRKNASREDLLLNERWCVQGPRGHTYLVKVKMKLWHCANHALLSKKEKYWNFSECKYFIMILLNKIFLI